MCIIIENTTGKPLSGKIASRCVSINSDGFGIYYLDNGQLTRSLNMDFAEDLLEKETRPYVAHCRLATVGDVDIEGVHPFDLGEGRMLFQNGTVNVSDRTSCDTLQLANTLAGLSDRGVAFVLRAIEDCRFAVTYRSKKGKLKCKRFGKWHTHQGVHFSKQNVIWGQYGTGLYQNSVGFSRGYSHWGSDWEHLGNGCYRKRQTSAPKQTTPAATSPTGQFVKVAVYGTLKSSRRNHGVMQRAGGEFLGNGTTKARFKLVIQGLPYLLRGASPLGEKVELEVYEVPADKLCILDGLEGHPEFYKRESIRVMMNNGSEVSAYCYFVGSEYDNGGPYFDRF